MTARFYVFHRIGLLGLCLTLCALGGCTQIMVMRQPSSGAVRCKPSAAGCAVADQASAADQAAAEQEPIIQPPTAKYHPVPTRPVFSSRPPYEEPASATESMGREAYGPECHLRGDRVPGVPELEVCPGPDEVYINPDRLEPIIEIETPRPLSGKTTEPEELPVPKLAPPETGSTGKAPKPAKPKAAEPAEPKSAEPDVSPFPDELPDPADDTPSESSPQAKSNVALSRYVEPDWYPIEMIEIEVPLEPLPSPSSRWRPSRLRR